MVEDIMAKYNPFVQSLGAEPYDEEKPLSSFNAEPYGDTTFSTPEPKLSGFNLGVQPEQPIKPTMQNPYDSWKTPVLGNIPLDRFVQLTGMMANAFDPDGPGGRMGKGLASMAAQGEHNRLTVDMQNQQREEANKRYEEAMREKRLEKYTEYALKANKVVGQQALNLYTQELRKKYPDANIPDLQMNDTTAEYLKGVKEIDAFAKDNPDIPKETINQMKYDFMLKNNLIDAKEHAKQTFGQKEEKITGTPQSNSVTERGGYPIWKDPRTLQTVVVKPDGTKEVYNPSIHGKQLGQNLSQTTIYNQSKKEENGFKSWSPASKEQEFMEHAITGVPPVNTRGLAGADRQEYAKEFAAWKVSKGFTPQMMALMKADYKAGDMTLKNMSKQEAPMSAFVLNINKQIAKVEELYKKQDRTGMRFLDLPIRELMVKAKGSGDEAVKASYLLEISNEIGKLSSGSSASVQQLSDSAKEDWKKVHDPNLSMKEIMKVVNATRDQANMRMQTWRQAKEEVRNTMRFLGAEDTTTTSAKPTHKWIPGQGLVEIK